MARFFIDRPIFAWVIAIVIMLAGALSIQQLPVSQYPSIAPPAIVINAKYPGASAKAVEDSVTQIIEQKLTGLDGLLYMQSTSDAYGNASTSPRPSRPGWPHKRTARPTSNALKTWPDTRPASSRCSSRR